MAALALILLGIGVVVLLVAGFLILATMDTASDLVSTFLFFVWYVFGWGCLIAGFVIGISVLLMSILS